MRNTATHGGANLATNNPSRTENSFTRKLKENRKAFINQKIAQQNQGFTFFNGRVNQNNFAAGGDYRVS